MAVQTAKVGRNWRSVLSFAFPGDLGQAAGQIGLGSANPVPVAVFVILARAPLAIAQPGQSFRPSRQHQGALHLPAVVSAGGAHIAPKNGASPQHVFGIHGFKDNRICQSTRPGIGGRDGCIRSAVLPTVRERHDIVRDTPHRHLQTFHMGKAGATIRLAFFRPSGWQGRRPSDHQRRWSIHTARARMSRSGPGYSLNRQPVRKIQRIAAQQTAIIRLTATSDTPTGTSAIPKNDQRKPETR